MITEPTGWSVLCDSEDCDNTENELCSDEFEVQFDFESDFEDFVKERGWAVRDGQHFCPKCAERMGLADG